MNNKNIKKNRDYISLFGSPEKMHNRINSIAKYLLENNPDLFNELARQAFLLEKSRRELSELNISEEDNTLSLVKILILLLDSLDYCGFIEEKYLSEELKIKKIKKDLTDDQIVEKISNEAYENFKEIKKQVIDKKEELKK
jgi:hypothetical protein